MNRLLPLLVLLLILLGGCSSVRVSQDYRPGVDFTRYASYGWMQSEAVSSDIRVNNPLLQERFYQAIGRELGVRGLVASAPPDMLVRFTYTITTRVESDPMSTSVGYGVGRNHRYGGIGIGTGVDIRQYDVGLLVIDLYDRVTGQLLWRGNGTETVKTHRSPEEVTAFVNRMVGSIMAQLPPRMR